MAERRRDIDRWLALRGLPNLAASRDPWPRANRAATAPLALWAVLCALVAVGDQLYGNEREVLVASVVIIGSVASWPIRSGVGRIRRLPHVDALLVAGAVLGPTALAAALGDPWFGAAAMTFAASASFIGLVYGAYAVGIAPPVRWVARRAAGQARSVVAAVARTWGGPAFAIVLGLVTMASTWRVAAGLSVLELSALLVLGGFGWSAFGLGQSAISLRHARRFDDDREIALWAGHWSSTGQDGVAPASAHLSLDRWARANALAVLVLTALVPVLVVGVIAALFTIVVGLVAVEPSSASTWLGQDLRIVATAPLGGTQLALSRELLVLAAIVGSVHAAALSVCGAVSSRWRARLFGAASADVRTALAVRAVELAASAAADAPAQEPSAVSTPA